MEWDELDLEAVEPDQDETAAEGTEMEEPDQAPADPLEGAAEESGEETADSDSDGSSEEETGSSGEDEAGAEDDISEEVQQPADETEQLTDETEQPADETEQPADVVTISGNAIIFPEEYALTSLASSQEDDSAVVQAVEEQTMHLCSGFAVTVFLLGIIAGLLFVQCFRLRRV